MKKTSFIMTAAAATCILAGASAQAQSTAFENQDAASDAVEDLEEQIRDDRDRDLERFGNSGRRIGSYGSVSARATATSDDDNDDVDLGVGLRFGNYDGVNGYDLSLSYNFGKSDDEETKNNLLAGFDYRRDLSGNLFAFGKADVAYDGLADEDGEYESDVFVGAGIGYRIYNDKDRQWSVQAGPGYRVANIVGEDEVSEAAIGVSSNYFQSLSETSYVTNDTDVIASEESMLVNNELALSVSMTNALALRTSLTTAFNDATDDGLGEARNTLGVSVVYNFQ
jgi:putative salt-induced outer membrane protein